MEEELAQNLPENTGITRNPDGTFKKGFSGNPAGKPPGTISPITRVKQIFADNPERFEKFVADYMEDKANAKHVVEMIDGKPKQDLKMDGTMKQYVISEGEDSDLPATPESEENNAEQSAV